MPEALDVGKAVKNLREVALFSSLDEEHLTAIAKLCEIQFIDHGTYLIREGEQADDVYILLLGEVAISKQINLPNLATAVPAKDRILSTLNADNNPVLGETALLSHASRRATVRCISNCAVYRINAMELTELMERDAVIGSCVYRHLSEMLHQRLESANNDVVKLSAALVFALED